MKKETKERLIGGFIILMVIGLFMDYTPSKETNVEEIKATTKETPKPKRKELFTLGDYKESSKEVKLAYIKKMFKANKWSKENERKYLTPYYDCMGDFAYQKDPSLTFLEVVKWCDNERANNTRSFYSHINELDVRNSGKYEIGYDKNIALLKKEKKEKATNISIALEKKSFIGTLKTVKKKESPFKALEEFGGLYTVKEISKNEVILYTSYHANNDEKFILEEAKRNFIDGVYQSFIYTDVDYIKVDILLQEEETKEQHIFSFQGSIKREDALKVAKELLNIKSFNDLVETKTFKDSDFEFVSYNAMMNRIRFNDAGYPTLNLFFEELSKVTY